MYHDCIQISGIFLVQLIYPQRPYASVNCFYHGIASIGMVCISTGCTINIVIATLLNVNHSKWNIKEEGNRIARNAMF